ncbi:MAG: AEC family transporter [Desulfobacteraceae bacterium]|nr:AEC family transporter [Desulfobacteraceae bacterium]
MLNILVNTILPIFSIILLGYLLQVKGIIDPAFSKTANQLVFNIGIPAMVINEIMRAPFRENFNMLAVLATLAAIGFMLLLSIGAVRVLSVQGGRRGTFVQSSFHGNIGYMAYAIAFYALGEANFARMAILSSFIMVAQNILAVWALTIYSPGFRLSGPRGIALIVKNVVTNPIIATIAVALPLCAIGVTIPSPLQKGLDILSGMALPTALILIGSSLSFGTLGTMVKEIVSIGMLKLFVLPMTGYLFMVAFNVPEPLILPGVILLASPPATISYVMATELGGDPELAATSVSVFTLASAVSYTVILSLLA